MDQNDHEETARADKLKDRTQRSRLAQQGRRAREKTNRYKYAQRPQPDKAHGSATLPHPKHRRRRHILSWADTLFNECESPKLAVLLFQSPLIIWNTNRQCQRLAVNS